ncbi:MAG: D-alanine--D-alanine ligase family protein [Myxococcota bacterium]|nr:D-alanine--D-alanine ligase family protein [Myxococcota bacterium]
MSKLRLGLVFGGRSLEHEISILSARSILGALDPERYEILLLAVDREGQWQALSGNEIPDTPRLSGHAVFLTGHASRAHHGELIPLAALETDSEPEGLPSEALALDVIFPIVHGAGGEDGSLQGLLELSEVAYVGSGILSSALQMDKDIAKKLLSLANLPVLPWLDFRRHELTGPGLEKVCDKILKELGYPLFIKPANSGSSVGINRALDRQQLIAALNEAVQFDDKVIVEQGIEAREIEVAVLGNEDPQASIPGEIVPSHDFYDYEAKYLDDSTRLLVPAPLAEDEARRLQEMAILAFRALEAEGMARVDFLMERNTGALYINELNSLPGFTDGSMYPRLWEETGLPYTDLLDRLVDLALERRDRKAGLKKQYGD